MKITRLFPVLLWTIMTGCSHGYKYWDVSKFTIVDSVLKDDEPIKLLYSSRGPDNNEDRDYYIQVVAVSQKTGDTVNILTFIKNDFKQEDRGKVFNFFDENNIATRLTPDGSVAGAPLKRAAKVARDPRFDHIADNNYPTVIGSIGIMTPGNN